MMSSANDLDSAAIARRLDADRRALLDLSLRNPLLNYRPRRRGLEVVGEVPAEVFRMLVREKRALSFLPAAATPTTGTPPPPNPTDTKLQTTLDLETLRTRL